ncbi:hypothetical protein COCNU_04G003060 [Cocos nucifera]|uniref:Retrotransposon gag domain-containing protein n=1 Tax=Cocos nucifera TaxID=13894 RepID=A0A8K0MZF0_COCNU|nr:hypothetical protein COCNU_04G003060 [Cocos nucifera]
MAALKDSLQKNDLLFSLEKKYPKDFVDLLVQIEGYARTEEAFKLKDEEALEKRRINEYNRPTVDGEPSEVWPCSRTPPERRRVRTPRARHQGSLDRRARRSPPAGKFHNYAPLNASKTQVLTEVKNQLSRSGELRSFLNKHDRSKYCLYHRDHSHDTEECIQLPDKIEELIRIG